MSFRLRLGPFTFGRSGTRVSIWNRGSGISIPLSNKKGTFGKVKIGPISGHFGSPSSKKSTKQKQQDRKLKSYENVAIEAFNSDIQLISRLKKYGVPWRAVQESLRGALPNHLTDRNNVAYRLVPNAMDIVFGKQNTAWKTEKRQSKSGTGQTTWIVIV